jgi:hypothetical protein
MEADSEIQSSPAPILDELEQACRQDLRIGNGEQHHLRIRRGGTCQRTHIAVSGTRSRAKPALTLDLQTEKVLCRSCFADALSQRFGELRFRE